MAETYTKKEFGAGIEEQTLLKDSNATRIVPKREYNFYFSWSILFLCVYNPAASKGMQAIVIASYIQCYSS